MKQQEKSGKNLKWILLSCLALVLVAGAAVAAVLLGGGSSQADAPNGSGEVNQTGELIYWNVERDKYVCGGLQGNTGRNKRSDGYYYFRLAVNGEQVDIPVADLELANRMDLQDYFGLVLDEDGVAVDMLLVEEFTGGVAADHWFVEQVEGTKMVVNTSPSFKGISVEMELTEDTLVYDVGSDGPLVGLPTQVVADDELIAIRDTEGAISTCYVYHFQEPGDVYWNIERMFDGTAGVTTRVPDALGFYSFQMAFGGQEVTIRTRDAEIASAMDKSPAKCMGLVFDEEGYVIEVTNAAACAGGKVLASWFHVMDVQGAVVNFKKIAGGVDQGQEVSARMTKYTRIVNVSGQGAMGEFLKMEDVRAGDQVHCLTDRRGNIGYMFIIGRISETAKLCWNVERMWDAATKTSTRTPAADGYYYIRVACEGEQFTVRTKDKELVTTIDSNAARCFSLDLNGDEVVKVSSTGTVTGGGVIASWFDIVAIDGNKITATKKAGDKAHADYGKTVTFTIDSDTDIFDVSDGALVSGSRTTLRVGDRIHGLTGLNGVHTVYVVSRPADVPVYWNITRKYDTETKSTTRVPDENGYYWFDMCVGGKQVRLKTADKEIANMIDATAARCRGLRVSGDTILKAYTNENVYNANGKVVISWENVTSIQGSTVYTEKVEGGKVTATHSFTLTSSCQIYNVSNSYINNLGEKTTLQVGDQIHCLTNSNGTTTYVFIVNRPITGKVGWNLNRKWDSKNQVSTRTPDAEGWYYIDLAIDGQQVTVKTQDAAHVTEIDSNAAMCRGYVLDGDVIKRVMSPSSIVGTEGGVGGSWVHVTEVTAEGFKAVKTGGTDDGKTYEHKLAQDVKVYNVSNTFLSHRGEETKLRVGDQVHVLLNKAKEASIVYVITQSQIPENAYQSYCNICQQTVTWAAWDGTAGIANNVHYYLEQDVHLTAGLAINNAKAVLFLNGHTLSSDGRVFRLENQTQLTVYDSWTDGSDIGGKIIGKGMTDAQTEAEGNGGASEGGLIMLWNSNTVFNLYSGTLELAAEHNPVKNGGVIAGSGKVNIHGGTIQGGDAANEGGNVRMFGTNAVVTVTGGIIQGGAATNGGNIALSNGAKAIISGGTIRNGTAIKNADNGNGGNIQSNGGTTLTITGGTIEGGQARRGGNIGVFGTAEISNVILGQSKANKAGTNLFTYSNGALTLTDVTITDTNKVDAVNHGGASLTLKGKVVIPGLYLPDGETVTLAGLTEGSAINVTLKDLTDVFGTVSSEAEAAYLTSANTIMLVKVNADKGLYLEAKPSEHNHCLCATGDKRGCTDHTSVKWTEWTDSQSLPTAAGNYYLENDVELATYVVVDGNALGGNKTMNICLNGHTINSQSRVFKLVNAATLNITDCGTEGKVIGKGMNAEETTADKNGGASEGGLVMLYNANTAFSLYGGTIELAAEHNTVKNGGVIAGGGKANIHGGTVRGGDATNEGGNIRMFGTNAVVTVTGGIIQGGAATNGGNIALVNGAKAVISGGTIQDGTAIKNADNGNGGNIVNNGGTTLTITGGTIEGGQARRGGNIGVFGTANISGVTLGKSKANKAGTNIFTYSNGALTLTDVTITDTNKVDAVNHGGASLTLKGKVVIPGLYIVSGKSIAVSGLTEGSSINVTPVDKTSVFGTVTNAAEADYFTSNDSSMEVAVNGEKGLYLKAKQ